MDKIEITSDNTKIKVLGRPFKEVESIVNNYDNLVEKLRKLRIFVLQSKVNKEDPVKTLEEVNIRLQGMEI